VVPVPAVDTVQDRRDGSRTQFVAMPKNCICHVTIDEPAHSGDAVDAIEHPPPSLDIWSIATSVTPLHFVRWKVCETSEEALFLLV
jgi:hypothetical protein